MRRAAALVLLLAACSKGPVVATGSSVTLEYALSSDGAVIESSAGRNPLVVIQGEGNLPGPVDEALTGMGMGEEKVLDLTPAQGFGPVDPSKIRPVPLAKFGAMARDLVPGSTVGGAAGGKAAEGRVVKVENGFATLDFNHPLAGKSLRYKIKILAISVR